MNGLAYSWIKKPGALDKSPIRREEQMENRCLQTAGFLLVSTLFLLISTNRIAMGAKIERISDNPLFFDNQEGSPDTPAAREIDDLIRPVLKRILDDAKFMSEDKDFGEHEKDGIVILHYLVRKLFDKQDARNFHRAMLESSFKTSPRTGSRPQGKKKILMGFLKKTYSIVILMDTVKQKISIRVYKFGKLDRLN